MLPKCSQTEESDPTQRDHARSEVVRVSRISVKRQVGLSFLCNMLIKYRKKCKKLVEKRLDFQVQQWYNAQANFVGTLVLCPFRVSIYRYWQPVMLFPKDGRHQVCKNRRNNRKQTTKERRYYCESKIISKTDLRKVQDY